MDNRIYWLETDQCEEVLGVCYTVWSTELSDLTADLGEQTEHDKAHNVEETLGYISLDNVITIFPDAGKDFLLLKKDMTICQRGQTSKRRDISMAVCTFLGHNDIYDAEIDSMLQSGIEHIVTENEKTDFLIFLRNNFYLKCFLAVLKARAKHPEKVTLTLVIPEEDYRKNQTGGIPSYLIDRIIFPKQKDLNSNDHKNVIRWLIRQSTHLICCLYRTLYGQENHILDYAQSKKKLQIIDITNVDTAQAILERTPKMSDRERFIFERLNDGSNPKEVAETIGVSRNRVAQVLNHGCRTLRESMRSRYVHLLAENREQRKSVCSIFSAGTVTYESLTTFEYIVSFLLSSCGVTHFEIAVGEQHSGFMYVLKKIWNRTGFFAVQKPSRRR